MIIVSGHLVVDPAQRRAYLDATFNGRTTCPCRRRLPGLRAGGRSAGPTPELCGADVAKYRIAAVEPP